MAKTDDTQGIAYRTEDKRTLVDKALEQAWTKGKKKLRVEVLKVNNPFRLARLHRKKFTASLLGEGIPGFQYLLARLVRDRLTDFRYPFLDMKCRYWELWVYPDGRLTIKFERKLGSLPKPLHLEYDLGHAAVS